MTRRERYEALRARGCTCGGEERGPRECPLHEPGDNRGIRAYLEAGTPRGFPMTRVTCTICRPAGHVGDCLLYPDVDQFDPSKPFVHRPTVICPRCSTPASEQALVDEALGFGIELNDARVFLAVPA